MAGSSHDPLHSFVVASGAVSKPGDDAASQDTLHSAGVECSEQARAGGGGGGGCLSTCPFAQSALLSRQFFIFFVLFFY